MCQPLMMKMAESFKAPEHNPRWCNISRESREFFEYLRSLRGPLLAAHIKRTRIANRAELLTGLAGPLVGSKVFGDVLLRGDLKASKLDVYSMMGCGSWCQESIMIRAGKILVQRFVDGGPCVKAGLCPAAKGADIQFQSADGWWFADEAEALEATKIFNTAQKTSSKKRRSVSDGAVWAGSIADENPLSSGTARNILAPEQVFVADQQPVCDESIVKPPVSAKGLTPALRKPSKLMSGMSHLGASLSCCQKFERNLPVQISLPCMSADVAKNPVLQREPPTKPNWSLVEDMHVALEVLSPTEVGLPPPTDNELAEWWEHLGLMSKTEDSWTSMTWQMRQQLSHAERSWPYGGIVGKQMSPQMS